MTLGKLKKELNVWQFLFYIGRDPARVGWWRFEIWCFSLLIMPVYGAAFKKHLSTGFQMYKGFVIGRSYRIPRLILRHMRPFK